MLDTVPFTMCCYRSLYHCGDRQSWRWSSMLRMTMMTGVKMMVEVLFPSLDWHPTDHVSFSDNAHLRTIARESKVQVITMMAWLAQYDDIMHGYHHNDHQSLLSGPIAMSDIRRGHLWRAWRHPENGTSHVAKTLCPGIKSFCHQLITLIIPQCLFVILSTYISITKAIVNVKISTNITFQESWGAELHKDLKVWLKKLWSSWTKTKTKTESWYLMKVFRCIRKPRWCTREAIPTSTPTLHSLTIRNSQKLASKNLSGKELLWEIVIFICSKWAYFDQKYSK